MMTAVATVLANKWGWPAALSAGTVILAIDSTAVTIAALGLVQAIALGWFGLRQHRADKKAEEAKESTQQQSIRVDRNDRLIDQLQEQLDRAEALGVADRERIRDLEQQVSKLRIKLTDYEIGAARLVGQIQAADIGDPVWLPSSHTT